MSNKKCTAAGFEPAASRAGHLYYNHYATNPESRNLHAINYMIALVFASNLVNLLLIAIKTNLNFCAVIGGELNKRGHIFF